MTFTPDLSWKDHILEITATANRIIGSLKKAFSNRDSHFWKNLSIYFTSKTKTGICGSSLVTNKGDGHWFN